VRASRDVDGKHIFAISGRGIEARLVVNSASGKLGDTNLELRDKAVHVCPVGAILIRHRGFEVPLGERLYDQGPISGVGDLTARRREGQGRGK
jgi:[NiFe] hydrogenase diaphorase moiety small subunit